MGLLGASFGLAALAGISERVELQFFYTELNDTVGRVLWTAGSLVFAGVGWLVLRATRRGA